MPQPETDTWPTADVGVENCGTIFVFRPYTDAAIEWIAGHVAEGAQFLGTDLACEPNYARDLAAGMMGDGLVLE